MSLQPLFLITPGSVSRKDIRRVEKLTGICMVECKNPEAARFLDAPPDAGLDVQARAALSLFRIILRHPEQNFTRASLTKWFVEQLLEAPKPVPVKQVKG